MKFSPIDDKTAPRFHTPFKWNSNGCLPKNGQYTYNRKQRYYGFNIARIQDFEIVTNTNMHSWQHQLL